MEKPIRVLHVVTYMGCGGLETMLMNYYRHIDRTKVQFDFLVHRDFEADYDHEILELGGNIFHLPRLNPFSIHYLFELNSFLKKHSEYKIIHVHQDCLSSIILKRAKRYNIPIRIAHSHNANQDKNYKYLIKRWFMKSIPKYATALFACGKDAGDWMFNGVPFLILNNAIETEKFTYNLDKRKKIRQSLGLSNEMVIGHVGRFERQKNHDFIIEIFHNITRLNSNTKLILVGSGSLQDYIKARVNDMKLDDKVIFLGNRNDVNNLLQAMDVFVFPSFYEGLPVTLIEAQASGLPIIKSDNISNQCVITPNVYSKSLSESAEEWAKDILKFEKRFKRKDMNKNIIDQRYDILCNVKWLQDYYLNEVRKYEE